MFSQHKSHGTFVNSDMILKLEIIQKELRHQRNDHTLILSLLHKLVIDRGLQEQVDKYFEEDEQETSPQTDSETN